MKAKAGFQGNSDDEYRVAKLTDKPIKVKINWDNFYFPLSCVSGAYLNNEGNINIYLPSGLWTLKYDKELWEKIITYLISH